MGGYHGRHSFHLFSHHKGIVHKSFALDNDIRYKLAKSPVYYSRYPPYTATKLSRLAFVRGLKVTPTGLLVGIGAVAFAGVAIFMGLTDFGRTQIQTVKSLVVIGLQSALKFLA